MEMLAESEVRVAGADAGGRLEELCRELLTLIGEDPARPGLADTPRRWARMWREFAEYRDERAVTTFESVRADQLVVVRGIRVHGMCEHHLLPFWADIAIGYVPRFHVLGLSKFARIAHVAAHRLQVQERLVEDIADAIEAATKTDDVAVLAEGVHSCMVARGIRTDAVMGTSVMRGTFRDRAEARAEFLALAR